MPEHSCCACDYNNIRGVTLARMRLLARASQESRPLTAWAVQALETPPSDSDTRNSRWLIVDCTRAAIVVSGKGWTPASSVLASSASTVPRQQRPGLQGQNEALTSRSFPSSRLSTGQTGHREETDRLPCRRRRRISSKEGRRITRQEMKTSSALRSSNANRECPREVGGE